jgi:uncharacterized protein YyaL (SSP411 family)
VHRFSPRANRAAAIAWRPFGAAAFDEARRLGRPVLLAIGAVWCHWCHVMDETTYSDEGVQRLIADGYVAVRVDRDLRPDVDRLYNRGGWPTTAILNAAGASLWGATYVPPDAMVRVLAAVLARYRAEPELADALPAAAAVDAVPTDAIAVDAAAIAAAPPPATQVDAGAVIDGLIAALAALEDRRHGGFGAPDGARFPQVEALRFLDGLAARPDACGRSARSLLARALDGMLAGELEDPVEGGFYRYATRPDWREPHFEKMLADNAALASLYLRAGARAGDGRWLRAGERALAFADRALWRADVGAYGGSQDADEAYARADASTRAAMGRPFVDPVVYAEGNFLMVETALDAWAAFGDAAWRQRARALWQTLAGRLRRSGEGFAHADTGDAVRGEAADQVAALAAAAELLPLGLGVDAAEACALADAVLERWVDAWGAIATPALAGGDGPRALAAAGGRLPLVQESGRAAVALARVGRALGEERYLDAARRMVARWAGEVAALGPFAAEIGRAAAELGPAVDVRVVVGETGPPAERFLAALRRSGYAPVVARVLRPEEDADRDRSAAPPAGAAAGVTVAYVCAGAMCAPPVEHPTDIGETIRRLLAREAGEAVW